MVHTVKFTVCEVQCEVHSVDHRKCRCFLAIFPNAKVYLDCGPRLMCEFADCASRRKVVN